MATIREISLQGLAEPASVKIEKNSKGYNIEVGVHAEELHDAAFQCIQTMRYIEKELSTTSKEVSP